jgi:hypothetical protein
VKLAQLSEAIHAVCDKFAPGNGNLTPPVPGDSWKGRQGFRRRGEGLGAGGHTTRLWNQRLDRSLVPQWARCARDDQRQRSPKVALRAPAETGYRRARRRPVGAICAPIFGPVPGARRPIHGDRKWNSWPANSSFSDKSTAGALCTEPYYCSGVNPGGAGRLP